MEENIEPSDQGNVEMISSLCENQRLEITQIQVENGATSLIQKDVKRSSETQSVLFDENRGSEISQQRQECEVSPVTLKQDERSNDEQSSNVEEFQIQTVACNKEEKPKILDSVELKWLSAACNCEYATLSKLLLQNTQLLNSKSFVDGNTALHYAAKFGDVSCVKLLVGTYKADVNSANFAGESPLHVAYYHNQSELCRLLETQYGADKNLYDYAGHLPRDHQKKRLEDESKYSLPGSPSKLNTMAPIIIHLPRRSSNGGHHPANQLSLSPISSSFSRASVSMMNEYGSNTMAYPGSSSNLPFLSTRRATEPVNSKHSGNRPGKGTGISWSSSLRKAKLYIRETFESISPQHGNSHMAREISSPLDISSPLMPHLHHMPSNDVCECLINEESSDMFFPIDDRRVSIERSDTASTCIDMTEKSIPTV